MVLVLFMQPRKIAAIEGDERSPLANGSSQKIPIGDATVGKPVIEDGSYVVTKGSKALRRRHREVFVGVEPVGRHSEQ